MRIVIAAILAVIVALPVTGRAATEIRRNVQFLGFSEDGSRFLLKIVDADHGTFLSLKTFSTNKQEKSYPIEDPARERKTIEDVKRRHRITDPGRDSQIAPDERHTLVGIPRGHRYEIAVLRDNRMATFQSIDVPRGAGGYAKIVLSGIHWNRDGRKIVVVVHKTLSDGHGMDADEALPFEFFAGSLRF